MHLKLNLIISGVQCETKNGTYVGEMSSLIFYPENVFYSVENLRSFGKGTLERLLETPKNLLQNPHKNRYDCKNQIRFPIRLSATFLSPFPRRRSVFSFTGKHPIGVFQVRPVVDFKGEKCAPAGTQFLKDP